MWLAVLPLQKMKIVVIWLRCQLIKPAAFFAVAKIAFCRGHIPFFISKGF
jgi:hypothetical protein